MPYLMCGDGHRVGYDHLPGHSPGVLFLTGLRSDRQGSKALALQDWCKAHGVAYTRFDYFGHGDSTGTFTEGTISRWRDDALNVLDGLTAGPQILVGSSLGGWLMLLVALARPERVHGLIGIAPAPDFTRDLLERQLSPAQQQELSTTGHFTVPDCYGHEHYRISRQLIDDGQQHLLLDGPIAVDCPVRLLHGMQDADVPWQTSSRLAQHLRSPDVQVTLVKDGDHRLSRPEDLALLLRHLETFCLR